MEPADTLDELNRTRQLHIRAELHSRIKHGIERLHCKDLPDAGVLDRIPDLDIDEVVATLIHICADSMDLYTDRNEELGRDAGAVAGRHNAESVRDTLTNQDQTTRSPGSAP